MLERLLTQVNFSKNLSSCLQSEDNLGFGGAGILLNENWIDKVIFVVRLNHWMSIRILVGKLIINIFSDYAPQTG